MVKDLARAIIGNNPRRAIVNVLHRGERTHAKGTFVSTDSGIFTYRYRHLGRTCEVTVPQDELLWSDGHVWITVKSGDTEALSWQRDPNPMPEELRSAIVQRRIAVSLAQALTGSTPSSLLMVLIGGAVVIGVIYFGMQLAPDFFSGFLGNTPPEVIPNAQ